MGPPSAPGAALDGRTFVVTGATSGIGQETALGLARRGARVLLVGRDPARAEAARRDVVARSGAAPERVEVLLADFARLGDVRALAGQILARADALHGLVNNAGVVNLRRVVTPDGHEATFAVNHLAPFLLTCLLVPRLRDSAPARIVTVSSDAHRFGRLDWDDLMSERRYGFPAMVSAMRVYGASKLANLLFNAELARRLEGSGVTANAVHPGGVATRLGVSNNGPVGSVVGRLVRPLLKTPAQGAETSLHVAADPGLEGRSGRYFADRRERQPSAAARDRDAAARLWRESERLVDLRGDEDPWST